MHLAERAAEDGKVLTEDEDGAAVYLAVAGNYALAGGFYPLHHLGFDVLHEGAEFHEAARVEQFVYPLAGGQLALPVLFFDAFGAAALLDLLAALLHLGDEFFHPGAGVVGHNVFMIPTP